jgi:hypothetical protein
LPPLRSWVGDLAVRLGRLVGIDGFDEIGGLVESAGANRTVGTVGSVETVDSMSASVPLVVPIAPKREKLKRPRRAVRQGNEREAILGLGADERADTETNDYALRENVPPHHGP